MIKKSSILRNLFIISILIVIGHSHPTHTIMASPLNQNINTAPQRPTALTPQINVLPASTVKVGQEVLFDASSSTYEDTVLLLKGRYEWDFGDDTVVKFGDPYYYSADSGSAISHFYREPGNYTVTLTISIWDSFTDGDAPIGNPIAVESTTTSITVTGQPPKTPPWPDNALLLDMNLNGNLSDNSPKAHQAQWQGGTGSFAPGMVEQAADLTSGAHISVADSGNFSNLEQISVSFWAKKPLTSTYGTLLDKPGQFNVSIGDQRILSVKLVTSQGTASANSFLAYEVDNTHWHHYAFTYDGTTIRTFIDSKALVTLSCSGTIASTTDNLLIGKSATAAPVFAGYIDEVRIYSHTLPSNDLFTGFDLWHAPFHARTAQYIYAQIPSAVYNNPTNKLKVSIANDNSYTATIFEKTGLAAEEKFLLRNANLPTGNYTLTAQLLDVNDTVLDQLQEYFPKPYNSAPAMGIDENNAFITNGQPFFPVTSWLLGKEDMPEWKEKNYINALYGEGYYDSHGPSTWDDYLTNAQTNGLYAFGPERWFDLGLPIPLNASRRRHFARNASIDVMTNYITMTLNQPTLAAWMWLDEPDIGGQAQRLPPAVVRAWTYASHLSDPQHPVVTNLGGYGYLPEHDNPGTDYDFINTASIFNGKRQFPVDALGFDVYPLEYWLERTDLNQADRGPIDLYAEALDRFVTNNYGLIPMFSFVEVCDVRASRQTPGPTADQVLMEAWLNVVHGIKGINWFHYFEYATIQYEAMTKFTEQINRLAPAILAAEPDIHINDNANVQANRVDTLVRYHNDSLYVFAVRLTEPDPIAGALYTIEEPATINVSFQLDEAINGTATVDEENRSVTVSNGTFSDTFARNAVHIYIIPLDQAEQRLYLPLIQR